MSGLNSSLEQLEQAMASAVAPMQDLFVPSDWITLLELIANGGFGEVWKAELKDPLSETTPPRLVAIKKLFPAGEKFGRLSLGVSFARELRVWGMVAHPNVLPLVGFCLDPDAAVAIFISPYQQRGSLLTYLREAQPNRLKRLELAYNTAEGLGHLHSMDICHGDIKPANVVIGDDQQAMLCDLGLARIMDDHPSGLTLPGFNEAKTMRYSSPELINIPGARRDLRSDVWAWAALLLQVATDIPPFHKRTEAQATHDLTLFMPPASFEHVHISSRMEILLGQCWDKEPNVRPEMTTCSLSLANEIRDEQAHPLPLEPPWGGIKLRPHAYEAALTQLLSTLAAYRVSRDIIGPSETWKWVNASVRGAKLLHDCRSTPSGTVVAVKGYSPQGERYERVVEAYMAAHLIRTWTKLDHPNILPLIGFYLEENLGKILYLTHFKSAGDIERYVEETNPSQAERLELAIDTARGLAYLHGLSPPLAHGGIDWEHVLISGSGRAMLGSYWRRARASNDDELYAATNVEVSRHLRPYFAFELSCEGGPTLQGDIWAWGCLLLQVFLGIRPYRWVGWREEEKADQGLTARNRPASLEDLSKLPEDLRGLIWACWHLEPDKRPDINHCLQVLTTSTWRQNRLSRALGRAKLIRRSKHRPIKESDVVV